MVNLHFGEYFGDVISKYLLTYPWHSLFYSVSTEEFTESGAYLSLGKLCSLPLQLNPLTSICHRHKLMRCLLLRPLNYQINWNFGRWICILENDSGNVIRKYLRHDLPYGLFYLFSENNLWPSLQKAGLISIALISRKVSMLRIV